jgi:hypothetical protein
MHIDAKCPICGRVDEDGGHLFFKCKTIRQVWNLFKLERERSLMAEMQSAMEVVRCMLNLKEEKQLTCLTAIWIWLSERNNIREGGRGRGAVQIAQSVSVYSRDAEVREEGRPEDPKTSSSMVQTTDRHPEA